MQVQKHVSIVSVSGAFGAGVFYISDLLLSLNKYGKQIPMADVIIMTTYYIAQLVHCLLYILNKNTYSNYKTLFISIDFILHSLKTS